MTLIIFLIIAGLALVVCGADWLVDGASAVARKLGISEFVIGLTIVGFGTSCPELVVSLTGALHGSSEIAIGNVVGSNIFNTLLILGLTALLSPIKVSEANRKRDIPITLAVSVILVFFALNKTIFNFGSEDVISRADGIVFLFLFAIYLFLCFKFDDGADSEDNGKKMNTVQAIFWIILGLGALVFGGRILVDNAVILARNLGVSEKIIAITLLAGGTSMPELATCIVAAAKHKDQLALGNILGSNVFNILLILGCAATVSPISASSLSLVDAFFLVISVLMLVLFAYSGKKNRIDRWEACILLALELMYLIILFR